MAHNESFILAQGLDLEDAKAILIHRGEVVNISEYLRERDSVFELITIQVLAARGDVRAIQYLKDNAEKDFQNIVYDGMKENVLKWITTILDNRYPDLEHEYENSTKQN